MSGRPLTTRFFETIFETSEDRDQLEKLGAIFKLDRHSIRALQTGKSLTYKTHFIKKRSGKRRKINEPAGKLKSLQRRFVQNYLQYIPPHQSAMAFRKGYSIKTHAQMHVMQDVVLSVDLKDFFPNTRRDRVLEYFELRGFVGISLPILAKLTTFAGGLPQGAPTSPVLSNLVNEELDRELNGLAAQYGAKYSRYCDDLAFSWRAFDEPRTFRCSVEGVLSKFGYTVQQEKGWLKQLANDEPELTGVAIKGKRLIPARKIRQKYKRLKRRFDGSPKAWKRLIGLKGFIDSFKRR